MPRGIRPVQQPGDKIVNGGTEYEIVRIEDGEHGSKNFVLKDGNGSRYRAQGKRVQHNTKITPVTAP